MRFQDTVIVKPNPTPTPDLATPPAPGPEAAAAAELPRAPLAPGPTQATPSLGVRGPAGLEAAGRQAAAEVGALAAAGPWGDFPVPFAVVWLCAKHPVFTTWHTVTYAYLRRRGVTALHHTEWDALLLGALNDRGSHIIAQWVEKKVRNPLYEISPDIAMGGVVAEATTRTLTVAQVGKAWGLSLAGCVYGPQ